MIDTDARGTWTLHLDVLVEVMAISQLEATALMATCRLLYQLGPPYALRHGVTLRTRSKMMSFVSFMLADAGRLAHLRSLDLGAKVFGPLPGVEAHATDASYILAHPAIALHTLILHDMEKVLACSPHLLAAIGALSTLKRLYVHGVGRAAIVALRTMRSQLVSATMALMGPLGYYPALRGHSAFSDVFSVLQLSAHTLQELDLSLGTPVNPARDIPVSCQFPHVHTFRTVLDTHFPQCTLLRLFPNLQNFHIVPGMGSFDFTEDPNAVWFMVALRDANSKIGLSPSLKLLECSGEITSLYPLTAHLTVSKLRVRGYVGMHELPFFRVVLAEAQPAELELDVHGLEVVEELAGILRELEPRTMRALTLNVSFRPGGDGEQVVAERSSHAALDTLLQTMSNLKVRVNVASRRPLVLPPGAGPPTAENPLPDFHPAPAPSSKISGANLTDAQRLDWHIAPQEA